MMTRTTITIGDGLDRTETTIEQSHSGIQLEYLDGFNTAVQMITKGQLSYTVKIEVNPKNSI